LTSSKAQHRLHKRYVALLNRGKPRTKVVTAVARELLGFIWALAVRVEQDAAQDGQPQQALAA
jgi:transposase